MCKSKTLLGLGILALSTAIFVACSGDFESPTSSGGDQAESTANNQSANNQSPTAPTDPEVNESEKPSGRIFKPSSGKLSGRGTNTTDKTIIVALAAYNPIGPNGQFIKGTFTNATVRPGADYELSAVPEPLCTYQADLWFAVPPSTRANNADAGPEFKEQEFLDPKLGGTAGAVCLPPTPPCANPPCRPPPPCDEEDELLSVEKIVEGECENRVKVYISKWKTCDGRIYETRRTVPHPEKCEEECDVDELEAQAKHREQQCENDGGTYHFSINEEKCKLWDKCKPDDDSSDDSSDGDSSDDSSDGDSSDDSSDGDSSDDDSSGDSSDGDSSDDSSDDDSSSDDSSDD